MVDDPGIATCLATHRGGRPAALALTSSPSSNGGKDNITVVVANYSIPSAVADLARSVETADYPEPRRGDSTDEFPVDTEELPLMG